MVEKYASWSFENDQAERGGGFDDATQDQGPWQLLRVEACVGNQARSVHERIHCFVGVQYVVVSQRTDSACGLES